MATKTLQHIATYCNILQHIATYCNILQHLPQKFSSWLLQCTAQEDQVFLQPFSQALVAAFKVTVPGLHQGFSTRKKTMRNSVFFRSLNHRLAASCTGLWLDFRCVSFDCCGWLLFFANVAVSVPFPVPTPVVDDEHVEDVVVGCCPCLRCCWCCFGFIVSETALVMGGINAANRI